MNYLFLMRFDITKFEKLGVSHTIIVITQSLVLHVEFHSLESQFESNWELRDDTPLS